MKILPHGKDEYLRIILRWGIFIVLAGITIILMVSMPAHSYSGPLKPLSQDEVSIRDNLKNHVALLGGKIGQRNVYSFNNLCAAANYIRQQFANAGYAVTEQKYEAEDRQVSNIIIETGSTNSFAKILVVGAHYDSAPGIPGANDNASGVAALIELARLIKRDMPTSAKIRFVAFVNEEPPFFFTDKMGSFVYAKECRKKGENIAAMFALETIGYYSDADKSQHYPPGFAMLYPDKGNFIGFIGNLRSRQLVRKSVRTFRKTTPFPSEGIATFGWIPGVFWSDHWSFWKHGYPAVMVTDTAPFRYPYYHKHEDTPEKIDYDKMARVVSGLFNVIRDAAK